MSYSNSEILFAFTEKLPQEYSHNPIVISGPDSMNQPNHEYLLLKENDTIEKVFEIKHLVSSGPYKEAVLFNNLLAVGHYDFLYLYDLIHNFNILRLELHGYFGHLYINNNRLFVADAGAIYCFDDKGKIIWKNESLGIDGVYISEFDDKKIYGSGEWDPPGGWKDFVLDINSGRAV
ncbi:MAG TPA: hypothetical protein VGQ09_17315 [Chitinophagaceae bacterium]|jgi:hypothetical protein|nr:hypothetical protein [Chitinophagaceae bacterium]